MKSKIKWIIKWKVFHIISVMIFQFCCWVMLTNFTILTHILLYISITHPIYLSNLFIIQLTYSSFNFVWTLLRQLINHPTFTLEHISSTQYKLKSFVFVPPCQRLQLTPVHPHSGCARAQHLLLAVLLLPNPVLVVFYVFTKNYLMRYSICSQASSSSPFFDSSQTISVRTPCYALWKPFGVKVAVISCDKIFLLNQNVNFPCLMKSLRWFLSSVQAQVKYWQQKALTEVSLFFWDRVSKVFLWAWNCPACKTNCFPHKTSLPPLVFQPPPLFSL
jgi:hypothetical protein